MRIFTPLLLVVLLVSSSPVLAQPILEDLWPNQDGKSFTYDGVYEDYGQPTTIFTGRLIFEGVATMAPGVEVQNLVGQADGVPVVKWGDVPDGLSPLLRRLWIARPELRDAITAKVAKDPLGFWPALLLGPAEVALEVGHRQTADHIGSWRDGIADWSWWYLSDQLFAGANFTLQLIPDLTSDVFLHGTVRGTAESVGTPAGSWTDATVVDYVIDQGTGIVLEGGAEVGTAQAETVGWVAFVPGVGPVASSEEFHFTSVDCPSGCEAEGFVGVPLSTVELSMRSLPVATANRSWGALKSGW